MDFDELPLGEDELAPMKPYSEERAEIMAEVGRILAEITEDL